MKKANIICSSWKEKYNSIFNSFVDCRNEENDESNGDGFILSSVGGL
ncbi:hypothetical protein DFA_12356 [Cavenderia fasciculata]|uniref:Uncharacterized protein n=1 Tax=Cavenderia fasciculata TaxID=261658 RepID=F4QDG1_CACFS|nr:uncharacterized protein DFA_12356 [Cavenderia fasciculata]EGG14579.1 hypothetical protein DFA_12356 [Cavenderia fasciculata]|eukprot:XP_004366099.1 hypothetical protein DFA_12356 [Cavenderia fasciculata]